MKINENKSNDSIDNYLIQIEVDKLKNNRTARHLQQIREINEKLKNK